MTQTGMYTTQLQAGLGLIQETRALLDIWQPGMTASELYQRALQSGQFPNVSARRLRNVVVECFAPRYLTDNGKPAEYLKTLAPNTSTSEFNELLLLYTSRANLILADFIREVYWERYAAGVDLIQSEEVKRFIRRGIDDGKTAKRWSDGTIKRVSSYLIGCCADYGMLGQRTIEGRRIVPFRIEPKVSAFLAHDLHFAGAGDNRMISHPEWQLFGLAAADVRQEVKQLSLRGHLIMQSAGDVTHISWKHKSMAEFVDVLTQG